MKPRRDLTLSLLMSYTYGAPSKARNLTSCIYIYIYMDENFAGDFASRTVHLVNIFVKTNKHTNYSFSLLIIYGSSYMILLYIAIIRERC
jgi:hypothetical protein